jgi:NAD(P)-dependent dehydrogenase (short-subunit alcohol dehydrogenase family)
MTTSGGAIVTGASSGIGRATALARAASGHPVVLAARRVDTCRAIAEQIRAAGGAAHAVRLDLADPDSVDAFAAQAEEAVGPAQVLVSNAGAVIPTGVVESEPDDFATELQVNLLGAQRLIHHLVAGMVRRRTGDVVLVTSDVVRRPRPFVASYVTAKWGLEGLGRALQMELQGTGVRASIVSPGPTDTEMGTDWDPSAANRVVADWTRRGLMDGFALLRPEDLAAAVCTVVHTPPGAHLAFVEVQPQAPIEPRPKDS